MKFNARFFVVCSISFVAFFGLASAGKHVFFLLKWILIKTIYEISGNFITRYKEYIKKIQRIFKYHKYYIIIIATYVLCYKN